MSEQSGTVSDAGAGQARRDEVAGPGRGARSEQSGTVGDAGGGAPAAVGVPGWALRLALGLAAAAATAVAMAGLPEVGVTSVAGIVMVLLVLGTAAAPGSVVPLLMLIGLVIYRVLRHGPMLDGGLAALVLLMPLVHQLAGIAAAVPARSVCRWAALRPAAIRLSIAVVPVEIALLVVALAR